MGKKIYKITESQMKSILENKKSSKNDTKEQISEDQLKNIFESLADKVEEYDNYNYPAGADADPRAPWNDNDVVKQGEYVKGKFVGVSYDEDEMLFTDKSNGKYYYTFNDAISDGRYDIYDELSDFLDIPQEEDEDEDGRYMVAINDWKDYIDQDELLGAMASYLNNDKDIINSGDQEKFENGDVWFMEVSPESIDGIVSDKLKSMVKFN